MAGFIELLPMGWEDCVDVSRPTRADRSVLQNDVALDQATEGPHTRVQGRIGAVRITYAASKADMTRGRISSAEQMLVANERARTSPCGRQTRRAGIDCDAVASEATEMRP